MKLCDRRSKFTGRIPCEGRAVSTRVVRIRVQLQVAMVHPSIKFLRWVPLVFGEIFRTQLAMSVRSLCLTFHPFVRDLLSPFSGSIC